MKSRRPIRKRYVASIAPVVLAAILVIVATPSVLTAQWPFDPSGHFYPKGKLAGQFKDFDHLTLLRSAQDASDQPRSGVYTTRGEIHTFKALHTNATLDLRKIPFKFTSTNINGTGYEFVGEFLNNRVFEEYVTDPNEIVAQGRLLKLKNGRREAEALVEFVYSAKPRDLNGDINVKYPSGKTDLIYAVEKGNAARVRELIAEGAQVNARGPNGATALEYAVRRFRGQEEMVEALIAAGADVNSANESGETALMFAGYRGVEMVERLLAVGAEANARAKDGRTPLIHAAQAIGAGLGSLEIVRALIRAKADLSASDQFGRTALSIAEEDRNAGLSSLLKLAGAKR